MLRVLAGALFLTLTLGAGASASGLKAGVAEVDITPPLGKYTLEASEKIATSVRDPLLATALVLETNRTRVAIVSLDLVTGFPAELFDPYRARLKRKLGLDDVVLTASHTHESLDTETNAQDLRRMPWTQTAMEKIYGAIVRAAGSAVPVRVGVGYGHCEIATNRRLVTPEGVVTLGRNDPNKSIKTIVHPVDFRAGVLRLDREDGSPLAVVVHYACHPVALMSENDTEFSADYVGEMRKDVEAQFPGHPLVVFWQGAAGDINLRDTITGSGEPEVKRYGHELAQAVLQAGATIHTSDVSSLSFRSETTQIPSRWPASTPKLMVGQKAFIDSWLVRNYQPVYDVPVGSLILGGRLALAFLPGEPFIHFQFSLDKRSPVSNSWIVGYCGRGSGFGYLPTIRAAAQGGYGGNGPETLLAVGAGEELLSKALIQIYEQLGCLHPLPAGISRPAVSRCH